MKKLVIVMLAALILIPALFAGAQGEATVSAADIAVKAPKQAEKTLVIAAEATFEEKWNPFMAESAYDRLIIDQVFTTIMRVNGKNEPIDFAGHIEGEVQADGSVIYTVSIQPGMFYTNGDPVVIDDYIYYMHVCADPSYTGPSAGIIADDIEGIKEYYYDNPNYAKVAAEVAAKYSVNTISEEDYITMMKAELKSLWEADPNFSAAPWGVDWVTYVKQYCGLPAEDIVAVDAAIAANDKDTFYYYLCKGEVISCWADYDPSTYWTGVLNEQYKTGETVKEISGIKKIDDYTCTVKYNSINIYGDRNINTYLVPRNYYGPLVKGDVSAICANMVPVGSGPYIWKGFADNIATCEANVDYFEGIPNIGTVKWQYVSSSDLVASLASGAIDICEPTGSQANINELNSNGLFYHLTDNAGYGYCGFNFNNMSLNVRKGLWCLMSNRTPSVKGYYQDIAGVIERPMTTVLAEYPSNATQYYPYSKDEALKYFLQDGYKQENGKLMKDGEQLVVNAYIGGDGIGDHPTYAMLVQAAEDLKSLGGELQVQDVNFNVLQAAMNDGTADIFCLAWGNVTTCDKTSQFHSTGGQNRYHMADARMDALLEEIVVTLDLNERRALVAEMLDLAMDLCAELPVYQRKNIVAYNPQNVNLDTLPAETTAFWTYKDQLWKLEMN